MRSNAQVTAEEVRIIEIKQLKAELDNSDEQKASLRAIVAEQAEQITALCAGIDKVNNEAVKHRRENQRLKEVRELLQEVYHKYTIDTDLNKQIDLMDKVRQILVDTMKAAQPQGGSDDNDT